MFPLFFITSLVVLPMMALAAPTDVHSSVHSEAVYQCNVGEIHCCNQVQAVPGNTSGNTGGLIGAAINALPLIGLDCDPISVLGFSGNNCAAQPVCCTDNAFSGLINILNCAPININL